MTESSTFQTHIWTPDSPQHAPQAFLCYQEIAQRGRRISGTRPKRKGRPTSALCVESLFQDLSTSQAIHANTLVSEDLSVHGSWGESGYTSSFIKVDPHLRLLPLPGDLPPQKILGKSGKFEDGYRGFIDNQGCSGTVYYAPGFCDDLCTAVWDKWFINLFPVEVSGLSFPEMSSYHVVSVVVNIQILEILPPESPRT